jgi:hypothetical protein
MWPLVFERFIVGIQVWLGTLSGYFFLKNASFQGIGMLMCFTMTLVFRSFCLNLFERRGMHLAMWGLGTPDLREPENNWGSPNLDSPSQATEFSIDSIQLLDTLYRTKSRYAKWWIELLKPVAYLLCDREDAPFYTAESFERQHLLEHQDHLEERGLMRVATRTAYHDSPRETMSDASPLSMQFNPNIPYNEVKFIPMEYSPPAMYQHLPQYLWLPKDPLNPIVYFKTTLKPLEEVLHSTTFPVSPNHESGHAHSQCSSCLFDFVSD